MYWCLGEYHYLCASTCNCVCGCLYIRWVIVVLRDDGCNCVDDVVIVFYGLITYNRLLLVYECVLLTFVQVPLSAPHEC